MVKLNKQVEYVKSRLQRHSINNISIHAPGLTNKDIEGLQKHFKVVKREPFGYIRFEV